MEADDPNAYTSDIAPYNRYETSLGLRRKTPMTLESTYDYVSVLPTQKPSGTAFEYSSVNTFVAAWLVEELTGKAASKLRALATDLG